MLHRTISFGLVLTAAACGSSSPMNGDMAVPLDDLPPGFDLTATGARALTLLYTNDEHSYLLGFGPERDDFPAPTTAGTGAIVGGAARRQVLLAKARAAAKAAGADSLTVSAGDVAMGTLAELSFASAGDYSVLAALGYDVACIGNHEFDLGPGALATAITAAKKLPHMPQLVASNLHFSATDPADDTLAALVGEGTESKPLKRYHVVTTPSGLKVGFFGILGADAAHVAPFKAPVRGSAPDDATEANTASTLALIYTDIQPVVDALRTVEKVDLVVALSHSGVDLTTPSNGDDYNIAQNVSGIDVIISGHSHTVVPAPIVVANTKTSKSVAIVQAGFYGRYLGRLPLTIARDGAVTIDTANAKLLPVDDTTIPDPTVATQVASIVNQLEVSPALPQMVSRAVGKTAAHDPAKSGDLYFYPLGTLGYDIPGLTGSHENNVLDLEADAEFAAAKAALPAMTPPDVAVVAQGVVRADLQKGKTGALTFGDAFRAFPLGVSPVDGTVGYPLGHAYIYLVELKAATEVGASLGFADSERFLGYSGLRVTVDTTRPAFDFKGDPFDPANGRVTKMEWNSKRDGSDNYDTVLYDVKATYAWSAAPGYNPLTLIHVAANLYVESFATTAGVTLKDATGQPLTLAHSILPTRSDGSEVKDFEAFAGYLKSICDANGGAMPDRYDASKPAGKVPRRFLCSGPACPP